MLTGNKKQLSLGVLFIGVFLFVVSSASAETTLQESVSSALKTNPQLQILQHNQRAVGHQVNQVRSGYFPRLDLTLGYGTEAHDDEITRARGDDDTFQDRGEAALQLTQLLYDGGETSRRVAAEKEKFASAQKRVLDNAEAIALDAVIAHMQVYRQQELVQLAEKNVKDHEDIIGMLEELQEAGAGSVADVVQAQGRLARSRASLANARSDLRQAQANYLRVVGHPLDEATFNALVAAVAPATLEQALELTECGNPKVLALKANMREANQRVAVVGSKFYPKTHLELRTSYEEEVESSQTYERNHQAMVRLRWNLLNGGADYYERKAAASRFSQTSSEHSNQLLDVLEETRNTWAEYEAAQESKAAYYDAVDYNNKTLDSYLKQFRVSQRTLLDVLDARNELYQSSGQLVTSRVNEVIAAYRLRALAGQLNETLEIQPRLFEVAMSE
ncbi:TolC family outer membrane protein [Desulfuromonas acetoxidans]|uniref:TolC family outer membrane protein n=1 Tax=Desulfuromonas acetoxidans TaxID=891 RepID=UPI00292ECF78|nr:TolC family outer membrane protein [Desulfuromonas acetoxidans]